MVSLLKAELTCHLSRRRMRLRSSDLMVPRKRGVKEMSRLEPSAMAKAMCMTMLSS